MILKVSTSEIKEGTTYESAIDLAGTLQPDHLQEIPDRTLPPASSSLSNDENTFLFFDLETTGLGTSVEIVQLACVSGDNIFNRYVLPSCAITTSATAVTGLHVVGGELFCHKEKTLSNHPACGSLPIEGFVDILHVFREVLPKRDTYRLELLVLDTMSVSYNAHSAVEDVKILQSLIAQSGLAFSHLKLAFDRGGAEGLENILSEKQSDGNYQAPPSPTFLKSKLSLKCEFFPQTSYLTLKSPSPHKFEFSSSDNLEEILK
ncbi:uncharacterized protein LOC133182560 [Saccostrea echinata]|uniref:uncharacterized protein LOC133182560 n=1 Tax=Saccostrea echinata TaxID=191078 RepID=UPI002A813028|nr:uncharacterized protein LOC133182560 [Saccostrea echinata]